VRLETSVETHLGQRERNEDYLLADRDRGLLLIADGMGGGDCGDRAAQLACQTALEVWTESAVDYDGLDRVRFVLRRVNKVVYDCGRQECLDLGTTLTLAAVDDHQLLVGHVGDTRLYRLRDGRAEQLTCDQRALGNQLRANIGGSDMVDPSAKAYDHKPGDVLLLATDGLWELFTLEELEEVNRSVPPNKLVRELVSVRIRFARDNASALVAWDAEAMRRWWSLRASDLRLRLSQAPDRETLAALQQAQAAANEPVDVVAEFTDAWQPSTDAALVGLAIAVLEPADQEAFLARLAQDRESIAALHALADRYQAAGDVGERAREWVRRAFDHEPEPERAAWLLQAHRGGRLDPELFGRLAREALSHPPGPWFDVWTFLWETFMQSPAHRDVAQAVLRELPASFPGSALLGQGPASHPVDQIWCAVLDEKLAPVVRKQADLQKFWENLCNQLQSLERDIADHGQQSDRAREEQARVMQTIEQQLRETGVHVQSIERRLDAESKEAHEGMTAIHHERDRMAAEVDQLKRKIDQLAKAANLFVAQPFGPPYEQALLLRMFERIKSWCNLVAIKVLFWLLVTCLLALLAWLRFY